MLFRIFGGLLEALNCASVKMKRSPFGKIFLSLKTLLELG
jgi:hypothetical protein